MTERNTGGGPSGRSPFPAASSRSNNPRPSFGNDESSSAHHHSPFVQGMLRFSPKSNTHSHISPLNNKRRDSVTNAGQRATRTRFFETKNNTTENAADSSMNEDDEFESSSLDRHERENADGLVMDGIPIDNLRSLAKQALLQSPPTAAFYSNILFSKTGNPADALLLAQAHVAAGQYEACLRILEEAALLQSQSPWEALLVACTALQQKKDWPALLELLEDLCRLPQGNNPHPHPQNSFHSIATGQPIEDDDQIAWQTLKRSVVNKNSNNRLHPLALICCSRGQAFHETGCGLRAATFWKLALRMDCRIQQAWEALLEKNLLTLSQAYELVTQELEFGPNQGWLRSLYLARIELTTPHQPAVSSSPGGTANNTAKTPSTGISMAMQGTSLEASAIQLSTPIPSFQTPAGAALPDAGDNNKKKSAATTTTPPSRVQQAVDTAFDDLWNKHKLQESPQVLAIAARRAYRRYDWQTALAYCQDLAQLDPAVEEAAFCYVATLVVLGHKRVLFRLAHEWVEAAPKSAHAWFAVGAYYFCIQRYHIAQRHFCRATRLDPQCTEAWIAFGCSFAACDESDQALASFRAAQRLSPGEHTSLMYMGMEYVRTNHLVLAQYFLQSALSASGGDPLCLHELGVLAALKGEHKDAINWFGQALACATGGESLQESINLCHDTYWEPTIFNLGHSYRKTRQFEEAATCFSRCVALCPEKFSAYSALAFTKQLMGDLDKAIAYYHQTLCIKPDDPFSTDMLNRALEEQTMSTPQQIFGSDTQATKNASLLMAHDPHGTQNDDSVMSEDMESDVDMSGTS